MKRVALSLLLMSASACAQQRPAAPARALAEWPGAQCWLLEHRGKQQEAAACFGKLSRSGEAWAKAEGLWGQGLYQDANDVFKMAERIQPKNAELKVRWAEFFLERYNPAEAATLAGEALQLSPQLARAELAAAKAAAANYSPEAVESAKKALVLDPKLYEAHEVLGNAALEDGDAAGAIEQADKALALSPDALKALAIRAAAAQLQLKDPAPWWAKLDAANPAYGKGYQLAARVLVLNRRYEEGIALYREAIRRSPKLYSAHSELGINLMRLGFDQEARQELELAHNNDWRDSATTNTLRLLDYYANFETFRTPTTVLRLDKKEAALLRPYFQEQLDKAIATFTRKYNVKLNGPVQLEVYPNHEDFAVRTTGMPGLGALGVTFGTAVAMDSPSGRPPGQFHWASTLWHELSHVFTLTATKHRVPRWFTEGMAVHEETAASPDWGDRLDDSVVTAISEKKLLPVAELDRGFIRPKYRNQVIVSYFQGGRICDFIAKQWGEGKLLTMLSDYAEGKPHEEVFQRSLGIGTKEFDAKFLAWLDAQVGTAVKNLPEWKKRAKPLAAAWKAKQWEAVVKDGPAVRDLFPEYVEAGSVYEMLADAYEAQGNPQAARQELERYSKIGGRSPATLIRLAKLQRAAGDQAGVITTVERLNLIYLREEGQHQLLGEVALAAGKPQIAIREFQSVLASAPLDPASANYNLAKALQAAGRLDDARNAVFQALETAPNHKQAQKLLLELTQGEKPKGTE